VAIVLKNYFKVCPTCRFNLRFDSDDQVRICPKCKSKVELSPEGKQYILETYGKKEEIITS